MIKRIIACVALCSCFFFFQTVAAQTQEISTPIEEPLIIADETQVSLSVEELSNAVLVAEKKLESIKKELRYTETLKGNKKYKKEIALKFEAANNDLKLAKTAYEAATKPLDAEIIEESKELIDEASTEAFP